MSACCMLQLDLTLDEAHLDLNVALDVTVHDLPRTPFEAVARTRTERTSADAPEVCTRNIQYATTHRAAM